MTDPRAGQDGEPIPISGGSGITDAPACPRSPTGQHCDHQSPCGDPMCAVTCCFCGRHEMRLAVPNPWPPVDTSGCGPFVEGRKPEPLRPAWTKGEMAPAGADLSYKHLEAVLAKMALPEKGAA